MGGDESPHLEAERAWQASCGSERPHLKWYGLDCTVVAIEVGFPSPSHSEQRAETVSPSSVKALAVFSLTPN